MLICETGYRCSCPLGGAPSVPRSLGPHRRDLRSDCLKRFFPPINHIRFFLPVNYNRTLKGRA